MTKRHVVPDWTIHTYDGNFEPMAFGPNNISLDVNDDDTVTIDFEVNGFMERVTVPIRWLTEYIAEVTAHRARREQSK